MATITEFNKDGRGVVRGECRVCRENCKEDQCTAYCQPAVGYSCEYCGCPPVKHESLPPRSDLIIKVEPGEDEDYLPDLTPVSQPGPSRRNAYQMGSLEQIQPRAHPRGFPLRKKRETKTKPCKELFEKRGELYNNKFKMDPKLIGVYTITYADKVIYVGQPQETPISKSLRSFWSPGNKQMISKFVRSVIKTKGAERLKVAWIERGEERHKCIEGKRLVTFRSCISKLQGSKPMDELKKLSASFD